jgi:hypothetical protein
MVTKSNSSASQTTVRKAYQKPTLVKGPALMAITAGAITSHPNQ